MLKLVLLTAGIWTALSVLFTGLCGTALSLARPAAGRSPPAVR